MDPSNRETSFKNTGAVEQDRPGQETNAAPLSEQLDHQYQDPLNKASDSGMAGKGQTPEFTGEEQVGNQLDKDTNAESPETVKQELTKRSNAMDKMNTADKRDVEQDSSETNQDPGEQQRENQNEKKDDDLAA